MIDSSLYDDPELYDLLFGAEPVVVNFYVEQARRAGGPVLELACGTGELLVPVALAGLNVVGLDASAAMLARAQSKADTAGARAQLVQDDMRTFEIGRQFELVYVASNSLQHLHDVPSLLRFFEHVRRHLTPRGQLIFDVANPDMRRLAREPGERYQLGNITHARWGEVRLEESSQYNAADQVTHSRWYLRSQSKRNLCRFSLRLRDFFPRELELLIRSGGFTLTNRFGDFDGSRFDAASRHQVCVCALANA